MSTHLVGIEWVTVGRFIVVIVAKTQTATQAILQVVHQLSLSIVAPPFVWAIRWLVVLEQRTVLLMFFVVDK